MYITVDDIKNEISLYHPIDYRNRDKKIGLIHAYFVYSFDNVEKDEKIHLKNGETLPVKKGCYTKKDIEKVSSGKVNPLRAAVEKSGQCGTSSSHGVRENSTEKHQPVSEGISWEPRIVSSHTAPQKIAKKISFQMTENDMMVA